MDIQLALTDQEVQAIISVLGDLPTKTNAFPLMIKIQKQVQDWIKLNSSEEN